MSPTSPAAAAPVVLFDGVCNLCQGVVQFIIQHDRRGEFQFAALQSEAARALLAAHGHPAPAASPDSVLLVAGGQVLERSAAVLGIARRLGGGWRLLAAGGGWLPRRWRDGLYGWVARHRYRWFGRQGACLVPTPALRARFLG